MKDKIKLFKIAFILGAASISKYKIQTQKEIEKILESEPDIFRKIEKLLKELYL